MQVVEVVQEHSPMLMTESKMGFSNCYGMLERVECSKSSLTKKKSVRHKEDNQTHFFTECMVTTVLLSVSVGFLL